jgi:hypothetical protein
MGRDDPEKVLDLASAADFLNQFLFREFLVALQFLYSDQGSQFAQWLDLRSDRIQDTTLATEIASWDCWFGYYANCRSLADLLQRCETRLNTWRAFLATDIDCIPSEVWQTKSEIGVPLHQMGNLLSKISRQGRLPLYVVLDQYEVLPELNKTHGTSLQRLVNTLIKARDPVVFFKIGARTYDWGTEVRIWGSESRIEVQRDYVIVNLPDLLMRKESHEGWLFPDFAMDVAHKRIRAEGYRISREKVHDIFGPWDAEEESWRYFRNKQRRFVVIRGLNEYLTDRIKDVCEEDSSPLELRLAAAWALERVRRGESSRQIANELSERPWRRPWWKKERIGVALLQIASFANQRKLYYGWWNLVYLAGGNITAFLQICNEIWDLSTRSGYHPLKDTPLNYEVQTDGVLAASEKWRARDKNELVGGAKRYEVFGRLGPAISQALVRDWGISNPGHSGFSLRESELWAPAATTEAKSRVARFLKDAVSWAILEERAHTSKTRDSASRRKWYLHPLLSPIFALPHIRVKEPLYTDVATVYSWIFDDRNPEFGVPKKPPGSQLTLNIGDEQ